MMDPGTWPFAKSFRGPSVDDGDIFYIVLKVSVNIGRVCFEG